MPLSLCLDDLKMIAKERSVLAHSRYSVNICGMKKWFSGVSMHEMEKESGRSNPIVEKKWDIVHILQLGEKWGKESLVLLVYNP